ncbi:accessory Sec system translocase SecA2 [Psychrobacillus sp. FSL H8-0483]|uniref:accessory Sec system translocase SecA2 n=1 Tax=Psychrobacillus sp. FSL H8-0483 TaxID=2921389 RepID=UPI00315B1924
MALFWQKIFPSVDEKKLNLYKKELLEIDNWSDTLRALTDEQLQAKTSEFKERLAQGEKVETIRPEAFAVIREAADRVLGMRHFDVQLIGGMVLSDGHIAEMPTGEGKTLVASLPSYLRALEGKGVHVITVNEYLAKRDRELIGQIHEFLGLSVGITLPMMDPSQKATAYAADITYGIGSEFGFDFLRDNMTYNATSRVQRPYHFALVDEVDSVLIDEAKTPLIIAGKTDVHDQLSTLCAKLVKSFKVDEHFHYDLETKTVSYSEEGIELIERFFSIDNLYDLDHQTLYHYMIQALRARMMFARDVDYIVKEGKVLLIDMFTGRPMEGRTLSNGLHQAIEAKEGLLISEENKTQASITIQNYFRMYPLLSGMTGTAKTEEKEFQELYAMNVMKIPTNRPIIREDLPNRIYAKIEDKYKAVAEKTKELHTTGQPVLIGTTSIIQSEEVSKYLKHEGIVHEVLNAKSIDQEISLISLAGQKGTVTVATNMAGRGTDIMLGEGVAELGGLYVIGTELHESRRIDNQLRGRSGRQGDPGMSEFFISLEDEMFKRYAGEELEKLVATVKPATDGLVQNKKVEEFITRTQRICEGASYSVREYNLKLDNVLNVQRKTIYELRDHLIYGEQIEETFVTFIKEFPVHEINFFFDEEREHTEADFQTLRQVFLDAMPGTSLPAWDVAPSMDEVKKQVNAQIDVYKDTVLELLSRATEKEQLRLYLIGRVDRHWLQHMDAMDKLKEGIGMRSYSQEDPMRQYEREGLVLFTKMVHGIGKGVAMEIANLVNQHTTNGGETE